MSGNFFHFLAESIHHFFIEQPVLQILDRIDQIDRWVLDKDHTTWQRNSTILTRPVPTARCSDSPWGSRSIPLGGKAVADAHMGKGIGIVSGLPWLLFSMASVSP